MRPDFGGWFCDLDLSMLWVSFAESFAIEHLQIGCSESKSPVCLDLECRVVHYMITFTAANVVMYKQKKLWMGG